MVKKFIAGAIKHPGELTAYAKRHGAYNTRTETISLSTLQKEYKDMPLHIKRAYNFYKNVLKKARHCGRKGCPVRGAHMHA